jgi:hypothetical protein
VYERCGTPLTAGVAVVFAGGEGVLADAVAKAVGEPPTLGVAEPTGAPAKTDGVGAC